MCIRRRNDTDDDIGGNSPAEHCPARCPVPGGSMWRPMGGTPHWTTIIRSSVWPTHALPVLFLSNASPTYARSRCANTTTTINGSSHSRSPVLDTRFFTLTWRKVYYISRAYTADGAHAGQRGRSGTFLHYAPLTARTEPDAMRRSLAARSRVLFEADAVNISTVLLDRNHIMFS